MSAWQRDLDDLKREAIRRTREEYAVSAVSEDAKCALERMQGMSTAEGQYGVVREAVVEGIATGRLKEGDGPGGGEWGAELVLRGWHILLSRAKHPDDMYHWHLSVMLYPKGRGSNEADWRFLGMAQARLGAPKEPLFGFPSDANAPIHWQWTEEAN